MAVTVAQNVIHMTALNDSVTYPVKVCKVIWAGCSTAAHVCEIKDKSDGSGNILFKVTGTANGDTVAAEVDFWSDASGLKVTTLGSGYVTLYTK